MITVTRGGLTPQLNDQLNAAIPGIFPDSVEGVRRRPRARRSSWARQLRRRRCQNMAPFKNNQNLFVFKDDYSVVFGKHFLKAGVRLQLQPEERGRVRPGLGRVVAVRRRRRPHRRRRQHGQRARRPAAARAWRSTSARPRPSARSSSAGSDLEAYASDSWKMTPRVTLDYGLRWSRFENPFDLGDTISSFDPSTFNPALGADACNGMLVPPGSTACAGRRAARAARPGRTVARQDEEPLRAAPRRRVGRHRRRQDGRARRRRPVLPARVAAERPEPRVQPAVQPRARRQPHARQQRRAVRRRVRDQRRHPAVRPRYVRADGLQLAVERLGRSARSRTTRRSRSATSAARARPAAARTTSTRFRWRHNGNRRPTAGFIHAGSDSDALAALRPYGVFGDANIAILDHGGTPRTTRCRRSS